MDTYLCRYRCPAELPDLLLIKNRDPMLWDGFRLQCGSHGPARVLKQIGTVTNLRRYLCDSSGHLCMSGIFYLPKNQYEIHDPEIGHGPVPESGQEILVDSLSFQQARRGCLRAGLLPKPFKGNIPERNLSGRCFFVMLLAGVDPLSRLRIDPVTSFTGLLQRYRGIPPDGELLPDALALPEKTPYLVSDRAHHKPEPVSIVNTLDFFDLPAFSDECIR